MNSLYLPPPLLRHPVLAELWPDDCFLHNIFVADSKAKLVQTKLLWKWFNSLPHRSTIRPLCTDGRTVYHLPKDRLGPKLELLHSFVPVLPGLTIRLRLKTRYI